MKFWKRAYGALKDGKSLVKASFLSGRSAFRNPDIEAAVIRATSHDESDVNSRNTQRVFAWVRISDEYLRQVLWAVSHRMWKTHDWVVALKGLMLLHGVLCCKVPGIQQIGRLPFNFTNFKGKKRQSGLNDFIRAYYAFLDEKSSFIFFHSENRMSQKEKQIEKPMDLIWLQKLQGLLNFLLQIQPKTLNLLVLEAMDCIVIEIYDICAHICNGITSTLLLTINDSAHAKIALSVLQKAKVQHQQLSFYLEFCREIQVRNVSKCPEMDKIAEKGIREIIMNDQFKLEQPSKSIINVMEHDDTHDLNNSTSFKSVISSVDCDVFQGEHLMKSNQIQLELVQLFSPPENNNTRINHLVQQNLVDVELPDLISFCDPIS